MEFSPSLRIGEWLFVAILSAIMAFLVLVSLLRDHAPLPPHHLQPSTSMIDVVGALKSPGVYSYTDGMPLTNFLSSEIELLDDADPLAARFAPKKINGKKQLRIPSKHSLFVHVSGAVHNKGWLTLPLNSRLSDITPLLSPLPNADLSPIEHSRRKLKPWESIVIKAQ